MVRVIAITRVLRLCLCNCEGTRARSCFSRSLPLSQGDESQMSGHADETVGEQQAGGVDGSSPPILKSTIKYSNRILLRGRRRKGFPDGTGQKLGVAGS